MARFQFDNTRLNYTIQEKGKEYNLRLLQRAQTIFTTLLNLLPSSYVSAVQGPNYTIALKAVAVELGRIELALEDVRSDYNFALTTQAQTRSDFLYSIIGYLVLVNGQIPPLQWDDVTFRQFLISLIRIYFQGSIPASMADVVNLFYTGNVTVTEDFLLVRQGAAGYDISDEFTFQIDITAPAGGGFPKRLRKRFGDPPRPRPRPSRAHTLHDPVHFHGHLHPERRFQDRPGLRAKLTGGLLLRGLPLLLGRHPQPRPPGQEDEPERHRGGPQQGLLTERPFMRRAG